MLYFLTPRTFKNCHYEGDQGTHLAGIAYKLTGRVREHLSKIAVVQSNLKFNFSYYFFNLVDGVKEYVVRVIRGNRALPVLTEPKRLL
jgi:hypothetical protein